MTEDDVLVICGDIGIMWPGHEKEGKYQLDWLNDKPFKTLCVRGNHDPTPFWRSGVPSMGNLDTVKLITGTLCNPVYGDKTYDSIFLVPDSAVLNLCGHKSLVISGASSKDLWNLVSPHEKERIKRLKRKHQFYRVIGKSWWPDESINVPYTFSLLNDYFRIAGTYVYVESLTFVGNGKKRVGYFDYVFTHDCPAFMCDVFARSGDLGRLRPTNNENFLELIKDHINYRYFIHGHMHTFMRYAATEVIMVSTR